MHTAILILAKMRVSTMKQRHRCELCYYDCHDDFLNQAQTAWLLPDMTAIQTKWENRHKANTSLITIQY